MQVGRHAPPRPLRRRHRAPLERILDRLVDDLRARGRPRSDRPPPTSLALASIDEYPEVSAALAA